ncbi:MAG: Fic family protein, partial [Nitrosopumilus sp. B06]
KSPGEFRTIQNMIGKIQGGKSEIIYRPSPPEQVQELTRDLEAFFQAGHDISPLIQCAMIHYQFEAIHPFLDGNGRIGRLILPLILCEKKIFSNPLLYLSAYFEKHQQEYYNGLLAVSQKSEWREWIEFFLVAFTEQAEETIRNIQEQQKVHKKYETTLKEKKTGTKTVFLLEHLIANPYITIPNAQEILKTSYPTAKNAIMSLVEAGILTEIAVIRGKKVFFAEEMDKILEC